MKSKKQKIFNEKGKFNFSFTGIPDHILERIYSTKLSGQELRLLLFVIQKTYGFRKETDGISNSQIVRYVGLTETRASQITSKLKSKNIIKILGRNKKNFRVFTVNANIKEWKGFENTESLTKVGSRKTDTLTDAGSRKTDTRGRGKVKKGGRGKLQSTIDSNITIDNIKDIKNICKKNHEKSQKLIEQWNEKCGEISKAKSSEKIKRLICKKLNDIPYKKILSGIKTFSAAYKNQEFYYNSPLTLTRFINSSLPRFVEGIDDKFDGDIKKQFKKSNQLTEDEVNEMIKNEGYEVEDFESIGHNKYKIIKGATI